MLIQRFGGPIAGLTQISRWSPGRVRGVVHADLSAVYPTIEHGEVLVIPFRHSAQSFRLTAYGMAVARVLSNRGSGISLIGELRLINEVNDGSKN